MAQSKERITVNIPPELKVTVEREAKTAGQTLSVWVERALTSHLAVMDKGQVHVQSH